MRAVLLSVMLLAPAALAQGSPAQLARLRFAAVEADASGSYVAFLAPGELELFDGEVKHACTFTAEGSGYLWALKLSCGGVEVERQWTWLPRGTAWTNLVDVPGGELARAGELAPPTVVPAGAIAKKPEVTFASLSGRWTNGRGDELELTENGDITVAGATSRATLRTCTHAQVEDRPRVPCLTFKDPAGKDVAFGLLSGFVWVEGRIVSGDEGEMLFEGWQGGRFFRRASGRAR